MPGEELQKIEALEQVKREMKRCRLCIGAGYDVTPPAVISGTAAARVMIIGQAPGVTEAETGRPMNAGSGRRLFEWLGAAGWDEARFRARHYMTAVTKCYPGRSGSSKGDRVPTREEQALCRPFLEQEITLIRPSLIIPVGGLAIKLFYPSRLRLNQIVGNAAYFPPESLFEPANFDIKQAKRLDYFDPQLPQTGRWLVPLPHPSGASLWPNRPQNRRLIDRAVQLLGELRVAWEL